MACLAPPPWISISSTSSTPKKQALASPSSSRFRVFCQSQFSAKDFKFVLHDALDSLGNDTSHARAAREGFLDQIKYLSNIERQTSICVNRCIDLPRAALNVAAEDDSLVSHSSVQLPIEAFIERLDNLSMSYFPHYRYTLKSSPEDFLASVERFLYARKGFRRASATLLLEPKSLYLHSVLTHRCGSTVILSLIYSEILKILRFCGVYEFDVEIYHPHDLHGLPRAYDKKKSKESDHSHILTTESLLVKMLKDLKDTYWPFQHDHAKSLFLRAVDAVNFADRSSITQESAFDLASAKAAQHRLDRGVWTSVRFGDMRCALAVCERLILLETDINDLRDYAILLYHCGFYEESLLYMKLYQETKNLHLLQKRVYDSQGKAEDDYSEKMNKSQADNDEALDRLEEDAVEKLMTRLNLILMEAGWTNPSQVRSFLGRKSEPW